MAEKIYLVGADNKLTAMEEQGHLTEDAFQKLLEDYPDILAGDQINRESPRRWLLVTRELGVPGEEGGGNRWSLDHLFLDQDGVPTLVEVKRSTDTRLRREVVGQMLDYAANGITYWPVESIRAAFYANCAANGTDADLVLGEFLALDGGTPEDAATVDFWTKVSTNLKAGKVRMVFFADFIPTELKRIVEFLNGQMNPAEVLAVEVKQFVGGGARTLVPRVIGLTAAAELTKRGRQWDEQSFFQRMEEEQGMDSAAIARKLYEWGQKAGSILWGSGAIIASFYPESRRGGHTYRWFGVNTHGRIEMQFGWLKASPAFEPEERRRELIAKLSENRNVIIPDDKVGLWPSIPLKALSERGAVEHFIEVFDWAVSLADEASNERLG